MPIARRLVMNSEVLSAALSYIDSWLKFRHAQSDTPGLVVTIVHKDKIIFNKAYGYANLEKNEKLHTGHIFRVASHSKTFTAAAIMQLFEKGKLHIEDNIVDYLPWLKTHKDSRISKITIRQLLSHSAGLIRDGLNKDYWQLEYPFPDDKQFKEAIMQTDLIFDTNVQMKYSNFGYGLLGMIVETASGVPYNQYVKENIIQSIKLKNTGPEYVEEIKDKLVTGYTRLDATKRRLPIANCTTNAMSAATGFYSTGEDLCCYFMSLIVGSKKLLDDESKKEMQRTQWGVSNTAQYKEYGLGLLFENAGESRLFGHLGMFPGQSTGSLCDPKSKLAVAALTNCIDGNADEIVKGIFSVFDYFQQNGSVSKSTRKLKRFQGRFMNLGETIDILVAGSRIAVVSPNTWQPFNDLEVEYLECLDDNTLKVVKTNGYASAGELVRFKFSKSGTIKSLLYCGATMWTEAEYLKILAGKKQIG